VIVIVYKPASFTTGLYVFAPDTMPGPVHATVTPYVLLLPNKLIVGLVQLITVSTPAFAFGDTVSIPTTTASVDVQPLIGCVAVTVYVVGTDTFVTAVFAPFDHANVAPDVDELADKSKLVLTQFTTVSIPAFTPGDTVSILTTTASLTVQPLIKFVAVTVYVLLVFTFVTAVVAPFDHAKPIGDGVLDVAVKFKFVLTHVNVVSAPADTCGVP
jgi:hypothetical protein